MKTGIKIVSIAVLSIFLITSSSYAKAKRGSVCRMGGMHGGMYEGKDKGMDLEDKFFKKVHFIFAYEDDINLSDDQKEMIINEKFDLKKDLIESKRQIEMIIADVKREFIRDDLDIGTINSLIDRKYDIKKEKAKRVVSAYQNLKNILSADQYNKLKDLWMQNMKNKMKSMMGPQEEMGEYQRMHEMEGDHMRGMMH
ncbi:MAG: hypothetical protein GF375_01590 [Candidatus Omnitrophica bacterium]|nr:hypothetical protein [Candidatus Omnitrophota bacterium]MBD3268820.1 hypothetical protein [Candidatus Omnitrophota bacterium]